MNIGSYAASFGFSVMTTGGIDTGAASSEANRITAETTVNAVEYVLVCDRAPLHRDTDICLPALTRGST